jgi:hypothetical protein
MNYKIYIIKNYFYNKYRSNIKNLVFINIVLISNFYINIILETQLYNSNL